MTEKKLIRAYQGRDDGAYRGRTFASILVYQRGALAIATEAGAVRKSPSDFLLPEGDAGPLLARMEAAAKADKIQVFRERVPVTAAEAARLKVGDEFDFGEGVGRLPITGFSTPFSPKGASHHDERLGAFAGKETVYVYNAHAPKPPKPKLTEEEKAERRAESNAKRRETRQAEKDAMTPEEKAAREAELAESLKKRDMNRIPVLVGSLDTEMITVAGESVKVIRTGQEWVLKDQEAVDKLRDRFPEQEFSVGDRVQFATFEAPDPSPEP